MENIFDPETLFSKIIGSLTSSWQRQNEELLGKRLLDKDWKNRALSISFLGRA